MNKLSIIGAGFVGRAVYHAFSPYFDIKIYDKYVKGFDSLEETLNHSEIIFICVPTPVKSNYDQDLSNINDVIESIKSNTKDHKILVIKSTVLPGTSRELYNKNYSRFDIIFNPEFLSERTSLNDFLMQTRIILGCNENLINSESVDKVENLYKIRFKSIPVLRVKYEEAELVKYMCNCYFSTKVLFLNHIYKICEGIGIEYEEVRKLFVGDNRITDSHTRVPGFDNLMGVGGKCFPKDLKSFISWCDKNNFDCEILKAVDNLNERIREKKDWLEIKGATTENNYE